MEWIRSRFLRHPYALWTALDPAVLADRLDGNLEPVRWWPLGPIGVGTTHYLGQVEGRYVRFFARGPFGANSWRWRFEGVLQPASSGSWITGQVGPSGFVPAFSAIWLGFVGLLAVFGWLAVIESGVDGQHVSAALPFGLIPTGMWFFFFGLAEVAFRIARWEWSAMDRWLRESLR